MRAFFVALLASCASPKETCPAQAPPPAVALPTVAAPASATSTPEPVAAAEPDLPSGATIEKPGRGTCTRDVECVLTRYDGCCAATCEPYATSPQDLATRVREDACERSKTKCPRAPDCRRSKLRVREAACRNGGCVAIFERNDPGY